MFVEIHLAEDVMKKVEKEGLRIIPGPNATAFGSEHFLKNEILSELVLKREKMVVVMEPFQRILSAYRNKIQPDRDDYFGKISKARV